MSAITPDTADPITQLRNHLSSQITLPGREMDYDMDDTPELLVLEPFEELRRALVWLDDKVNEPWRTSDRAALSFQSRHRLLARAAISAGTGAIVLGVLQLAIELTLSIKPNWPAELATVGSYLEGIAVGAAVVAVSVGIFTKLDRRWLEQRHCAERLRMIKFRAIQQLLHQDRAAWEEWVTSELQGLKQTKDIGTIEEWSKGGEIEPGSPVSVNPAITILLVSALTTYYLFKRLAYQANYFHRRGQIFERQISGWRHLNLPLFIASALLVLAHFLLEYQGHLFLAAGWEDTAESWEAAAVWCAALSAIIPILGLGMRAWFAAFELPRNATLFTAKHRALVHAAQHLESDFGKPAPTLQHVTWSEHFLEHEHREWLRLLLETEWFL